MLPRVSHSVTYDDDEVTTGISVYPWHRFQLARLVYLGQRPSLPHERDEVRPTGIDERNFLANLCFGWVFHIRALPLHPRYCMQTWCALSCTVQIYRMVARYQVSTFI